MLRVVLSGAVRLVATARIVAVVARDGAAVVVIVSVIWVGVVGPGEIVVLTGAVVVFARQAVIITAIGRAVVVLIFL